MAIRKSQLYSSIWQSCDELRGGMDASQYKDYVLVMLFMRYVSDKYAGRNDGIGVVPEGGGFQDLVALKGKKNIGEGIDLVISKFAEANELRGVIDNAYFNDEDKLGSGQEMVDRLSNLVGIFENPDLDFSKNKAEGDDLLGDAYEYLMKNFAVQSGKSKGQFYTPAEVSRIIARVIDAKSATQKTQTVYDPTCGSGSLLLKVNDEAPNGLTIYGQELDVSTASLAKLNLWLHGKETGTIEKGKSTLSDPAFKDRENLKTFDFVVSNPPFSYKAWRNGFTPESDIFSRFEEFGVPPKKSGDFAFLLHIVKSLKSTGKGAVILPHGVLFRGNAEGEIREKLIQRGYIKGIIGLPANLFYGTGIPACIIVIDKEEASRRRGIFMIDASKGFVKDGNKNRLREQDIRKIIDTWEGQLTVPQFSRFVENDEIQKHDYNLNIPRYIDAQETEDIQDIEAHLHGGIPNADIDALADYWQVCPKLKSVLFKPSSRTGYSDPAISPEDVKKTIFAHEEFTAFHNQVLRAFHAWVKTASARLQAINDKDHPKAIIQMIGDEILTATKDLHLIDKYDIYQHLMAYWEETMQDDAHIITADGWDVGKDVLRLQKESKGKKKDIDGLEGLEGRLIRVSLIIKTYFTDEKNTLDELNAKLEQIDTKMTELKDEHGDEEGLLADVIDNDKITKGAVQKRAKEIKDDADSADELAVLKQYLGLFDEIAETMQRIKKMENDLVKKVIAKYPTLTADEVKTLVIEKKWMADLESRIANEMDHQSQKLAGRVKELVIRYAEPLPELEKAVSALTAKVDEHLKTMGFTYSKS